MFLFKYYIWRSEQTRALRKEEKMSHIEFSEFNPDYEPSSTGTRWKAYKERFENFMIAKHAKEFKDIADPIKKASLLHFGGEKVLNLYNTKK